VRILNGPPTIGLLAAMRIEPEGATEMAHYYQDRRPECMSLPEGWEEAKSGRHDQGVPYNLLPHGCWDDPWDGSNPREADFAKAKMLSDNEVLCELAGRSCYASFGSKSGRKTNKSYLEHIWKVNHASVLYHAKMSFFFGGISRRVSHELIRTYVGADRSEEGSPSQESTRFTEHTGCFIEPPYINRLQNDKQRELERAAFKASCQASYKAYRQFVERRISAYKTERGKEPRGMARKRIYEAASGFLHHSCETSMVWTTNPAAIFKQFMERTDKHSDLEYQRFAAYLMQKAYVHSPNLFPTIVGEKLAECEERGVFAL
jgi:thymidylate synthase (FAD)